MGRKRNIRRFLTYKDEISNMITRLLEILFRTKRNESKKKYSDDEKVDQFIVYIQ